MQTQTIQSSSEPDLTSEEGLRAHLVAALDEEVELLEALRRIFAAQRDALRAGDPTALDDGVFGATRVMRTMEEARRRRRRLHVRQGLPQVSRRPSTCVSRDSRRDPRWSGGAFASSRPRRDRWISIAASVAAGRGWKLLLARRWCGERKIDSEPRRRARDRVIARDGVRVAMMI